MHFSKKQKDIVVSSLILGLGSAAVLLLGFSLLREINSAAKGYAAEKAFEDIYRINEVVEQAPELYPAKLGPQTRWLLAYGWHRDTTEPLSYKVRTEPSVCEKIEGRSLVAESTWTVICAKGYNKDGKYWGRVVRQKALAAEPQI